jgi:hypothetical protein
MKDPRIPNAVAIVAGTALGKFYYSHNRLEALFMGCGAPGDPPLGNCCDKCIQWLKRASADPSVDAYSVLGRVLEEFMEVDMPRQTMTLEDMNRERQNIRDALSRFGLSYQPGGKIFGGLAGTPARSLSQILASRDLVALETEFQRALQNVASDPAAAITAASAIIEAFCKVYLADEAIPLPKDQTIKPLWKAVQENLGLDPSKFEDDDLKRILSGLTSIVDGLGAFRTHVGSAHGRGRAAYKPQVRHARLALHAAYTLVSFAIETWDDRRSV